MKQELDGNLKRPWRIVRMRFNIANAFANRIHSCVTPGQVFTVL